MVRTRLSGETTNVVPKLISDIQHDLDELKTGIQLVEAKLYDLTTGNSSDVSGTTSAVASGTIVKILTTVQSTDSTPLVATFTPVFYINGSGTQLVDKHVGTYSIAQNIQVSDDPTNVRHWIAVVANTSVGAGTFTFKMYCHTTSPATMSFTRQV